jgi:hypothetical protein
MPTRTRLLAIPVTAICLLGLILGSPASNAHQVDQARQTPPHRVHACHGHPATIKGNRHENTIIGTRHRDVIWAGPGRDRVIGRGGRDLICGGPGRDTLDGNKGDDTIYGGPGADWCVAWHPREHRLHHGCEIHVGLPPGQEQPQKQAPLAPQLAPQSVKTPSTPGSPGRQAVTECAPSTCSPGVATCDTTQFTYTDLNDAYPSAYTADGGYLAVAVLLAGPTTSGGWEAAYAGSWKTYQVPPGNWLLAPDPSTVQIDQSLAGLSGYLVAYFSYSPDGQNWSPVQYEIETYYYFAAGGYGSGLATNECNL